MKKQLLIYTLFAVLLVVTGCSYIEVSTEYFPEPLQLKRAIARSIKVPFDNNITVIYNSFIGICGNSSRAELNWHYEPRLDKEPFSQILQDQYSGKILFTGDELYAMMDSLYSEKETNRWEAFSGEKIKLSILGEAVTNHSVKINEIYDYNEERIQIKKLFKYSNNEWIYEVIP